MTRIGLVLGGGGPVGLGYQAGALAALAEATGWDARSADVVVGTSAGSLTAAALRSGLSALDLLAWSTGRPPSAGASRAQRPEADSDGHAGSGPVAATGAIGLRRLRPAAPSLAVRALRHPRHVARYAAAAGLLPRGAASTRQIGEDVRRMLPRGWPEAALWVCAVGLGDGRRVVFGHPDGPRTDVGTACEASCAVPGIFHPVRIGHAEYIDGGMHSATNADLLAGHDIDLAIVVAPMAADRAHLRARPVTSRLPVTMTLGTESRSLRSAGQHVLLLRPTSADAAAMGWNPMNESRRARTAIQSRSSVLGLLQTQGAAHAVDLLTRAARP